MTADRFIVAVDSDGTVLDAMTPKHRHAFTPALIDVWQLHADAAAVSAGFLHLNLHSRHRGANRFIALGLFLADWSVNASRTAPLPDLAPLHAWIATGGPLTEKTCEAALAAAPEATALRLALEWSREVNRRCAALPPPALFPGADAALLATSAIAEVMVVSSGNGAAIRAEWSHAGIAPLAREFLTQEAGPKDAVLRHLAASTPPGRVLMLGDAPIDEASARAAGVAFFPVIPGREADSWRLFREEILPAFAAGSLAPSATAGWTDTFHAALQL